MLFIGSIDTLNNIHVKYPNYTKGMMVFNISSYSQHFQILDLLPPCNINFLDQDNFDLQYFNFIFKERFMIFMNIIIQLYYNQDVFLLITPDPNGDIIIESLTKIILNRYGYISYFLNDADDIIYSDDSSTFSLAGLAMLDQDKKEYMIQCEIMGRGI